jgi:hypothetical protein
MKLVVMESVFVLPDKNQKLFLEEERRKTVVLLLLLPLNLNLSERR